MSTTYPPLSEVRKRFKVDWYRCPVEPARLRDLTKKSDLKGFLQSIGHLALIVGLGTLTVVLFEQQRWVAAAISLWLHGTVYSFVPGLVTHELSHGTVFKTKWMNGLFLRIYSSIAWVSFHQYMRSHTFHHVYTLFPEGDREVELPADPTLRFFAYVRLFTFDWRGFPRVLWGTIVLAFTAKFRGHFKQEWSEAIFPDEDKKGRRAASHFALFTLLLHLAVLATSIITGIWSLSIVFSLGSFTAPWWKHFIGYTMHTGLRDNVADFRKCCRTIKLDPFSRFLYWNMNFHTEHHMYGAVPCYNLGKLSKEIAWDMPRPRTLRQAWREMFDTFERQKSDPSYQFDTPVPEHKEHTDGGDLGASLGNLAPELLQDTAPPLDDASLEGGANGSGAANPGRDRGKANQ